MALVRAQLSKCTSPSPKLPQWSKGNRPAALPVIKRRLHPSLLKRSHITPLTYKKDPNGSLSRKGLKKGWDRFESGAQTKGLPLWLHLWRCFLCLLDWRRGLWRRERAKHMGHFVSQTPRYSLDHHPIIALILYSFGIHHCLLNFCI